MEALHLCEAVDLVQVVEDVGWRGVRIERDRQGGAKGKPFGYPVERGTLIPLGDRECLLWMHGDVKGVAERSYYRPSAFIHTGLTRARGSMFTHFTPADLVAILNIPRLQTLPNSFKILREYRLSVVALVFSR